jgi:Asp-tRNA(Asn)/Glu-tRNA(Gln) amidotransferase A subunit family amidase
MTDHEICWMDAVAISRRIRARELSAEEVARVFVRAIEEFDKPINSVVTLNAEGAIRAAQDIDRRMRSGEFADSPIAGASFLAKDLDITAGLRTTFGSLIHKDYVSNWDMFHIARLRAAGCVLLGKTNTPEDGAIPSTHNQVFGVTRNPWNLDRTCGGSSGGSGAAVAAGFAPMATASDGAGSIRIPASFNGCFGLKPTFGMIPFGPKGIGVLNTIGHLGPITRTVADAAAMLDVMAGPDERDRTSIPKSPSFLAALAREYKPRRVAFSVDLGYAPVAPDVRRLFMAAVEKLAAAGWPLEEAKPRFDDPKSAINTILTFEWGSVPHAMKKQNPKAFELQCDYVKALAEERERITTEAIWQANSVRKNVCVAMGDFFEKYDLLLTPAVTRGAFEAERNWPARSDDPNQEERTLNCLQYPFNLTGDPACSIPMGFDDERLPAGLQIVGPRFEDARVFQAAAAFERMAGADSLRPPHGVGLHRAASARV